MKNILTKLVLTIATVMAIMPLAYASNIDAQVDSLLPRPGEESGIAGPGGQAAITEKYNELEAVGNLPKITIQAAMTSVIKTILGWAMIITLVALVVMGIYYLISMGNEEDLSKAKNILLYLIIGMAIMAAAYGVVAGVSQFDFFDAPSQ